MRLRVWKLDSMSDSEPAVLNDVLIRSNYAIPKTRCGMGLKVEGTFICTESRTRTQSARS